MKKCFNCHYYNADHLLRCAVNPDLPEDCIDFREGENKGSWITAEFGDGRSFRLSSYRLPTPDEVEEITPGVYRVRSRRIAIELPDDVESPQPEKTKGFWERLRRILSR